MTSAHTKDRLARLFDYIENSSQQSGRILFPGMTLPAENDVRRTETTNSLERHVLKWLNEDLESGNQTAKHRANLAWADALTIDSVVDEVNEHYFKQYSFPLKAPM